MARPKTTISIDTISVTIDVADPEDRDAVRELVGPRPASDRASYGRQRRLAVDGDTVLFQAGSRYPRNRFLRLQWQPALLRRRGHRELLGILRNTLGRRAQRMVAESIVTRVDFALDIFDRTMESLYFEDPKKRKRTFILKSGLETVYLGSRKGDDQTAIYDKSRQLRETQRMPIDSPWVRVERRMKPRCLLSDLAELSNPFERILAYDFTDVPAPRNQANWAWFLAHCRLYGRYPTIRSIKNIRRRGEYWNAINSARAKWWKPKRFQQLIDDAVARCGLSLLSKSR